MWMSNTRTHVCTHDCKRSHANAGLNATVQQYIITNKAGELDDLIKRIQTKQAKITANKHKTIEVEKNFEEKSERRPNGALLCGRSHML